MKKYALITGASSGIGKALAIALASRKINVLLVALPNTGTRDIANEIRRTFGVEADGYEVDLTSPHASNIIFDWCKLNYYRINMLVNNAGVGNLCAFEQTDPQLIKSMMLLNNQALVLLTHRFIPELKKNKPSYILNVGSLASFMATPNKSVYAATKSFVYSFSMALRMELAHVGVSVSCLCPGGTLTSKNVRDGIRAIGASRHFVQHPEEVANAAVNGMLKKKFRIIPGVHNRILYRIRQMLPEPWVCWILQQIFNRKNSDRGLYGYWKSPSINTIVLFYR